LLLELVAKRMPKEVAVAEPAPVVEVAVEVAVEESRAETQPEAAAETAEPTAEVTEVGDADAATEGEGAGLEGAPQDDDTRSVTAVPDQEGGAAEDAGESAEA
jgi:hypothetical protein